MPLISSPSDSGNIIVINADDPSNIRLAIRGDFNRSEFFQWFNFNLSGEPGQKYALTIENAGQAKYPEWNDYVPYETYASYGNDEWFTVNTVYDEQNGHLTMDLTLEGLQNQVQFAFFPPYPYAKHLALIEKARNIPHCEVSSLGKTNGEDGRDITLLTFGTPAENKKEIWLIARQHPGEPQAEWYTESLIEELAAKPELLEQFTFRVIPNMNPDGTYLGNLRTNKEGADLNRMWENPSIESSPEVYYVLEAMKKIGVHFFLDIHSDEIIPKPFLDEAHLSCPIADEILEKQERDFMNFYIGKNGMQNVLNYGEKDRTDPTNMTTAASAVGYRFQAPAWTLEMPTKNWSWQQCKLLAKDFFPVLNTFYAKLQNLDKTHLEEMKLSSPGKNSFLAPPKQTDQKERSSVATLCNSCVIM